MRLLWAAVAVVFTALYVLALPQTVQKAQLDPRVWLEIVLQAFYLLLGFFVFGDAPTIRSLRFFVDPADGPVYRHDSSRVRTWAIHRAP